VNKRRKRKAILRRGARPCRLCGIASGTITAHCYSSCGSEGHRIFKRGWQARGGNELRTVVLLTIILSESEWRGWWMERERGLPEDEVGRMLFSEDWWSSVLISGSSWSSTKSTSTTPWPAAFSAEATTWWLREPCGPSRSDLDS
jgi:hypothetical protein